MKSFTKSTTRLFKKHIARFITIIAIVIVSIGFMSGIGEVENKIITSANGIYTDSCVSDLHLKSKRLTGFTNDELALISSRFNDAKIKFGFSYETKDLEDDVITRIYSFDLNSDVNKFELDKGRYPTSANEILAERKTFEIDGINIGETVTLPYGNGQVSTYTVVGIVTNPLILVEIEEPSLQFENRHINNAIYIPAGNLNIVNDVYISLLDRQLFNGFSDEYEEIINGLKDEVNLLLGSENVQTLSLYENYGFYSLVEYAKKVGIIGIIFVVFFLLVTLLVVYSTMSRLFDEERPQIACLKTLGYSNLRSILKYVIFVLTASVIGAIFAFFVGLLLTWLIYNAFNLQYAMPPFPNTVNFFYYAVTTIIMLVATTLLTLLYGLSLLKKQPATLLLPKAPKAGKKVMLEKIPFIWNALSFKYKSTFRNVLLFKSRFFMTVISIIGSTVLIFAGLGLMDCSVKMDNGESLITISGALIVFSAMLCALVIYNLTNINVSERTREIATLMVLGYNNEEVTGYIYREVYIMGIIGAVLGIPFGVCFVEFVFNLITIGSLSEINWWTYLITPLITLIFTFLSTLLLKKKIISTDMNSSLKTIE